MPKITGLGGIFYAVKDPAATRAWYRDVLGLDGEYGPMLRWSVETGDQPYSLLGPFSSTDYFKPSGKDFMINLRVDDLDAFVEVLKGKGIEILGHDDEGYGKFAWIMDPDGVKIELWQQVDPPPAS
ncbi:VOC family protein [Hyphobacterium marinum]|uniref:VOC family protein n=1 Tax=Hyphobacterium marinum TaxID=3116574 RepID=A0ABU7M0C7_9PROT|nr:VOC family protein [Hyphobacterium sp. Y6023]MEE2567248.1 VOC family protein [Hyphobacterium sp. Y6023]